MRSDTLAKIKIQEGRIDMRSIQLVIKRCFDVLSTGVVTIILLPFWGIIVILMKLTMPGPIFFKQERIGKNFRPFEVLKFRTMKVDKDAEKNFKIEKDVDRITPLGKFLRRSKLDETPQMLNVLKGDMSVVGPRPTVKQRVEEYAEGQKIRLSMRPGLTGVSQVSGNVMLSWPKRIEYDCEYVNKFTIWLDIKIIIRTIAVVIFGEEKFISDEDKRNNINPVYDLTHKK